MVGRRRSADLGSLWPWSSRSMRHPQATIALRHSWIGCEYFCWSRCCSMWYGRRLGCVMRWSSSDEPKVQPCDGASEKSACVYGMRWLENFITRLWRLFLPLSQKILRRFSNTFAFTDDWFEVRSTKITMWSSSSVKQNWSHFFFSFIRTTRSFHSETVSSRVGRYFVEHRSVLRKFECSEFISLKVRGNVCHVKGWSASI